MVMVSLARLSMSLTKARAVGIHRDTKIRAAIRATCLCELLYAISIAILSKSRQIKSTERCISSVCTFLQLSTETRQLCQGLVLHCCQMNILQQGRYCVNTAQILADLPTNMSGSRPPLLSGEHLGTRSVLCKCRTCSGGLTDKYVRASSFIVVG